MTLHRLVPILALLLIPLTGPASVAAQFGIQGGINLTNLVGSGVESSESRSGLNAGLAYDLLWLGPISIGAEVHYAQRGADAFQRALVEGGGVPPGAAEVALEYVEVPLVAKVRLPEVGRFLPFASGGPVFGWKLDCSVTLDAPGGAAEPSCDDLLTGEGLEAKVRDYEQGLFLGGGVEVPVLDGIGRLTLEGRLLQGLSRLNEGSGGADVRNRAFSLMLGYAFGL
jgi:hypothetical protein